MEWMFHHATGKITFFTQEEVQMMHIGLVAKHVEFEQAGAATIAKKYDELASKLAKATLT